MLIPCTGLYYKLYKTQDMHFKMQEMFTSFLLKNKLEFQPFLSIPVEDHVQEMRQERI